MKKILLLLLFLPSLFFGQIDTELNKIDSVLVKKEYEIKVSQLKKDFNIYKDSIDIKNQNINTNLKKIDSTLNVSTTVIEKKFELLNEKLQVLEKKEVVNLSTKLQASEQAITEMINGLTIITFVNKILELQTQITKVTNIWNDEKIRNGWDKAQTWGTVAGTLIAGASLASGKQNNQAQGATIGISVIGITSLLKKVFGKENSKQYEMIDVSRKAYDDLVLLNSVLKNYITDNEKLKKELDTLKLNSDKIKTRFNKDNKGNQEEVKIIISKIIDKLDNYNSTLNQIPRYIAQIDGIVLTFAYRYENKDLKEIFTELSKKSKDLKTEYETKVKPILDVSPEIKQTLIGI
jgi:hypothetical protein